MPVRLLPACCLVLAIAGCGPARRPRPGGEASDPTPSDAGPGDADAATSRDAPVADAAVADARTDVEDAADAAVAPDAPDTPLATDASDAGDVSDVPPADAGPGAFDCTPWLDLADTELLAALHRRLHDDYRPITVRPDLGGNPNRYTTARHHMFTEVEWSVREPGGPGGVECVYTGRFFEVLQGTEPDHTVVNCEHTWPRSRMAGSHGTALYEHQQSDVHALYPATAEVNSLRDSDPFGEPVSELDTEHAPAISGLDAAGHAVFQPRAERRGDVARALFYFSTRWGRSIDAAEEAVLRRWAGADPVDARETTRNDAVEQAQGNRNPFVDCPGLEGQVEDFEAFPILDTFGPP